MNDQVYAGESISLQTKRAVTPHTMTYAEYLKLQTKMAADQAKNTQPAITNTNTYQVQKSDTLYSIARKYNTSVEEIKEKNNLDGNELKPGQTLVIAE